MVHLQFKSEVEVENPIYYAVIFTSRLRPGQLGYEEAARRMLELVRAEPGFLGFASASEEDGLGITVSYWDSLVAVRAWGQKAEHRETQARGRAEWYQHYTIRIAEIVEERAGGESAPSASAGFFR